MFKRLFSYPHVKRLTALVSLTSFVTKYFTMWVPFRKGKTFGYKNIWQGSIDTSFTNSVIYH